MSVTISRAEAEAAATERFAGLSHPSGATVEAVTFEYWRGVGGWLRADGALHVWFHYKSETGRSSMDLDPQWAPAISPDEVRAWFAEKQGVPAEQVSLWCEGQD